MKEIMFEVSDTMYDEMAQVQKELSFPDVMDLITQAVQRYLAEARHEAWSRLIIKEVCRNLTDSQTKALYLLLNRSPQVKIIDEPVPIDLVQKYVNFGLPEKAGSIQPTQQEFSGRP